MEKDGKVVKTVGEWSDCYSTHTAYRGTDELGTPRQEGEDGGGGREV